MKRPPLPQQMELIYRDHLLNDPCIINALSLSQNIVLSLEDRDADELVLVLTGYHRLLTSGGGGSQEELNVVRQKSEFNAGREICEFTQPIA